MRESCTLNRSRHDVPHYPNPTLFHAGGRFGGFCDGVDQFDAGALRMSPAEAAATDPQQRVLLELTLLTLADVGAAPPAPTGAKHRLESCRSASAHRC